MPALASVLALVSGVVVECHGDEPRGALWMDPRLPFSNPSRRPVEGRVLMGIMLATAAVGQAIAPALDAMRASLSVAASVLMGLIVTNLAIRRVLLARVESLERRGGYDV